MLVVQLMGNLINCSLHLNLNEPASNAPDVNAHVILNFPCNILGTVLIDIVYNLKTR